MGFLMGEPKGVVAAPPGYFWRAVPDTYLDWIVLELRRKRFIGSKLAANTYVVERDASVEEIRDTMAVASASVMEQWNE